MTKFKILKIEFIVHLEYSADLTGGPLFTEEFDNLFEKLPFDEVLRCEWDKSILLINSEAAKQRVAQEIRKRLKAEARSFFWEGYIESLHSEKPLLILFVCTKTYGILFDFLQQVVFEKLKSYQKQLEKDEFRFFVERKRADHPELDEWSESTMTKVTNVIFLMLRQAGMLKDNQLLLPDVSSHLILLFLDLNEKWFLEFMMIPYSKLKDITNGDK